MKQRHRNRCLVAVAVPFIFNRRLWWQQSIVDYGFYWYLSFYFYLVQFRHVVELQHNPHHLYHLDNNILHHPKHQMSHHLPYHQQISMWVALRVINTITLLALGLRRLVLQMKYGLSQQLRHELEGMYHARYANHQPLTNKKTSIDIIYASRSITI